MRAASRIGLALLALLVWISLVDLPGAPATTEIDFSWMQALGELLKSGRQAGRDYLFTFGPLGYFYASPYDGALFWPKLAWELGVKGLAAGVFVAWGRRLAPPAAAAWFALLLLAVSWSRDAFYPLAVVAATLLLLRRPRPEPATWGAALLLLALLSLVKFSWAVLSTGCVGALAAVEARRTSPARGGAVAAAFLGLYLLGWLATGQSPANLPRYLAVSLEVSSAYNEAMTLPGEPGQLALAVSVLISLACALALVVRAAARDASAWAAAAALGLGLALAWKHSFVRQDAAHEVSFFAFAALVPFLFPAPRSPRGGLRTARRALAGAALAACALGFALAWPRAHGPLTALPRDWAARLGGTLSALASLVETRRAHEARVASYRQQYDLPRVRAAVGDACVDALSYELGVLLLNRLRWCPRPTLQSYAAYGAALLAANARFLASEEAPPFLLLDLQSIEGRYPTADEGPVLPILLRDYAPVLAERNYLLLRRERRAPGVGELVLSREVRFGEDVAVPPARGGIQVLRLELRYTLWGWLRSSLYKPSPVFLEIAWGDGGSRRYALVPGMARAGFVLDPFLGSMADVVALYTERPPRDVRTFRVVRDGGGAGELAPSFGVELMRRPAVRPLRDAQLERELVLAAYPMFRAAPNAVRSGVHINAETLLGEEVLLVHAPGEVRFPIEAGRHRLAARFGIQPRACDGPTDGVVFRAVAESVDGNRAVVFERYLQPCTRDGDRGVQALDVAFETAAPGELVLVTDPGPAADESWDWSAWGAVEIR